MIRILPAFFLIVFALTLAACQPTSSSSVAILTPDLSSIRQAWQTSPHANTYDQGKGPNTYCARCHAPRNWDPAAKIDAQPNCVSCKFSFDPAMRIAKSNPPVAKTDWKDIGCEVCHLTENGLTNSQIAWFNQASGRYETVANSTELCEKCHTDTETIRHKRDLANSAHAGFSCTRCHDAHTTVASCTNQACHPNVLNPAQPIRGHDKTHETVSCIACHDGLGLTVGIDKSTGTWIILRTTELLGRSTTAAYQSHNIQRTVNCDKCHGLNNVWGIQPIEGGTR